MSAEENVRRVQDLYAAFDRGDVDSIIAGLADNLSWGYESSIDNDIPWFGKLSTSADVATGFFQPIGENLDLQVFDRESIVASGNQVAVAYRAEGTIKKNGNSYIDRGMHLWTLNDDGKVVEYVGYADTAAILKAWNG